MVNIVSAAINQVNVPPGVRLQAVRSKRPCFVFDQDADPDAMDNFFSKFLPVCQDMEVEVSSEIFCEPSAMSAFEYVVYLHYDAGDDRVSIANIVNTPFIYIADSLNQIWVWKQGDVPREGRISHGIYVNDLGNSTYALTMYSTLPHDTFYVFMLHYGLTHLPFRFGDQPTFSTLDNDVRGRVFQVSSGWADEVRRVERDAFGDSWRSHSIYDFSSRLRKRVGGEEVLQTTRQRREPVLHVHETGYLPTNAPLMDQLVVNEAQNDTGPDVINEF